MFSWLMFSNEYDKDIWRYFLLESIYVYYVFLTIKVEFYERQVFNFVNLWRSPHFEQNVRQTKVKTASFFIVPKFEFIEILIFVSWVGRFILTKNKMWFNQKNINSVNFDKTSFYNSNQISSIYWITDN